MSDNVPETASWDRMPTGFGTAWGVLAASVLASVIVGFVLDNAGVSGSTPLWTGVLAPVVLLALLAGSYASGRRQFALGVLAAFGSMFALTLLLVAACFGFFAVGGF